MDQPKKPKQMDIRRYNYSYTGADDTKNSMRDSYDQVMEPPKKKRKWLKWLIIIILLIALGVGAFLALTYLYIDNIRLKGEEEGRVNFVISGVDQAAKLSDTLMIASLKTTAEEETDYKAAVISVPRDLYVEIEPFGYNKINSAYSLGENNKVAGGGPALIRRTVEQTFGLDIHYQATVDFRAFKDIVNAVDGVTIDVPKDIYDPYYPGRGGFRKVVQFEAGKQKMNGGRALQYARSRQTTSDFDRAARQQQVMLAVKEKLLSPEFALDQQKVISLQKALAEHVETDMSPAEMLRLAEIGRQMKDKNITRHVFDNQDESLLVESNLSGYTLSPRLGTDDFSEVQKFIRNIFKETKNTLPESHKRSQL